MHLASPQSAGLFHSAVLQSGGCGALAASEAQVVADEAVDAVGCSGAEDVASCLRQDTTLDALVALSGDVISDIGVPSGGGWGPSVDGHMLVEDPLDAFRAGRHNDVPVVLGSNAHETAQWTPALTEEQFDAWLAATFGTGASTVAEWYPLEDYASPRWAWIAITSDATFTCPAADTATLLSTTQASPVWRYWFSNVPTGPSGTLYGAWHGLELVYLFQALDRIAVALDDEVDASDRTVAAAMAVGWSNLAATGDPATGPMDLGTAWPALGTSEAFVLELGETIAAVPPPRGEQCAHWSPWLGIL